jgi:dihydrofolate reductase
VSKVIWHITMSLDGFIAGPDDSMDWVVGEWSDDGTNTHDIEVDRSPLADEVLGSAGAILGGRRWYDVAERSYDGVDGIYGGQWQGPVLVLTHRPPEDPADDRVSFVSTSLAEAVATARTAANEERRDLRRQPRAAVLGRGVARRDRDPPRAGAARRRYPPVRGAS